MIIALYVILSIVILLLFAFCLYNFKENKLFKKVDRCFVINPSNNVNGKKVKVHVISYFGGLYRVTTDEMDNISVHPHYVTVGEEITKKKYEHANESTSNRKQAKIFSSCKCTTIHMIKNGEFTRCKHCGFLRMNDLTISK